MANELTDLDLGEWSICVDPANEDCSIEIVKSKSGLAPVLKETDMSDNIQKNDDGEHDDADFAAFAEENGTAILEEFDGLSADEQANALVGLAYENASLEGIAEEQAENIDGITKAAEKVMNELSALRPKHEAVLKTLAGAGVVIEKAKAAGFVDDEGLVAEIRKANGGTNLSPEAEARIVELEKANQAIARKDSIAKARTYGFGAAEDVADIEAALRKSNAPLADKYVAQIKQAGAAWKASGLAKAIGEDAGNADANDPITKAKGSIEAIMKAKPDLTYAQASAQYWAQNPDAYAAMRQGQATA